MIQRIFGFFALAVLAVAPLMEGVGLYGKFEGAGTQIVATMLKRTRPSSTVVVLISLADAESRFGGERHVDVGALEELIDAIRRGNPVRIGVDLVTSDKAFARLNQKPWRDVVWARHGTYSRVHQAFFAKPGLGGQCGENCGIAVVRGDADGTVRQFHRGVRVVLPVAPFEQDASFSLSQVMRTFNSAILADRTDLSLDARMIDFRPRSRLDLSAGQVIKMSTDQLREKFNNKYVLIGGDYEGEDEHDTPLGARAGVQILADVIDTELDGRGHKSPARITLLLIAAGLGSAAWLIFRRWPKHAPLVVLAASAPAAIGASLLAYRSLADFVLFIPVIAIAWGQRMYERVRKPKKAGATEATRAR